MIGLRLSILDSGPCVSGGKAQEVDFAESRGQLPSNPEIAPDLCTILGKRRTNCQSNCPTRSLLPFDCLDHMRRLFRLCFLNSGETTGSGTAANFERFLSHGDFLVGMKFRSTGDMSPVCFSILCWPTLVPEWATHAAQTLSRRAGCQISGTSAKGEKRTDIRAVG